MRSYRKIDRGKTVVGIILLVLLGLVIFFITYSKKEAKVVGQNETVKYYALICRRNFQTNDDILTTTGASSVLEELKVTYRNDVIDDLFFSYEGMYEDEAMVKKAETEIHSKYHLYIGPLGIGTSEYANTYNFSGNKLIMNLMASAQKIHPSSLKLFFLDSNKDINNMQAEDFQREYLAQGFSCDITK